MPFQHPESDRPLDGIFVGVLPFVIATCVIVAACVAVVQAVYAPEWVTSSLAIAAMSGLISIVALVPGVILQRTSGPGIPAALVMMQAAIWATAIRVIGTVALTALCQYHMGDLAQPSVFLILGYYVILTTAEVTLIARRSSGPPQSSRPLAEET